MWCRYAKRRPDGEPYVHKLTRRYHGRQRHECSWQKEYTFLTTGWQHCRYPVSAGSMRTHLGFNPERSGGAALTVIYGHYLAQSTGAGDGSVRQTLDERSPAKCPAILGGGRQTGQDDCRTGK